MLTQPNLNQLWAALGDQTHRTTFIMKFESISTQSVARLPSISPDDAHRVNIFETLGIDGCLLDCEIWKAHQATANRRTTTNAQKREKAKALKELGKLAIKEHRPPLNSGKRVLKSVLKSKRRSFKLKDLEASFKNGCQCCRFFNELFIALLSNLTMLAIEHLVFAWVRHTFLLTIQDERNGTIFSYQFFSPVGAEMIIQGSQTSAILLGDTSSDSSLAKVDEWIQECKMSHKQCGIGIDTPLPKRCLDIELIQGTNGTGIRVAETEGICGTYACLSHCWGQDPKPIETKTKTLSNHLKFISWSELPKTFQDAVVITRKLGIRYLWIDSLCIIQDSKLDWEVESGKMADIYQNSFITIAAVSSPDSRGGCFSRDKRADIMFQVEGDGINTILGARYCEGAGPAADFDGFAAALPLFTRGWVYQERMLSRRILHCNHREFQFECREMEACECGSRSLPPHTVTRSHASEGMMKGKHQYAQLERFKAKAKPGTFSQLQVNQHWQKIVAQYTKLKLTYGTDILPALSGCAKDINRFRRDKYLAGLWRSSMAEGMLWMVKAPVVKARPKKPRAPTWSWASVEAPHGIVYVDVLQTRTKERFEKKIDAAPADCVLAGADTTGAVQSGFILLETSLCPVYLRRVCKSCRVSRSRVPYTLEYDRWVSTRSHSIQPCPRPKGIQGLDIGSAGLSFFPDFKYDRSDFDALDTGEDIKCKHARAFLLHLYDVQSTGSAVVTDFFLVLKKDQHSGGDQFERIAVISLEFKNWVERESWFENVYKKVSDEETIVRLV